MKQIDLTNITESSANAHKMSDSVPVASVGATAAILARVFLPAIAKGVIMRRPTVMTIAEKFDLDRKAVRCMESIHSRYQPGPVLLKFPGRTIALIIDPDDVDRVLSQSPQSFAIASAEKRAALAHFEPENVLLSEGVERDERRRGNEEVLDSRHTLHRLAQHFIEMVNSEAEALITRVQPGGELVWPDFARAWFRIVRRVVFGDAASEDHELSRMMAKLRFAANWAFLRPHNARLRSALLERINEWIARAEPESLAGIAAHVPSSARMAWEHQVTQWLFAFDPAGMTVFRALALLCVNPDFARKVRDEIETVTSGQPNLASHSRSAVLETLRLWPTTPLILRESRAVTSWDTGRVPAQAAVVIFTPFFHRNRELPYADRFTPELWTGKAADQRWPLIPFSDGPAVCPGRSLVLLLTTGMIAAILKRTQLRLGKPHALSQGCPLPGTLNHFGLRFELRSRGSCR